MEQNKVKMIAHRGLSSIEQENTIAAFIAAGNRSYFGTECDIHLTRDNIFVLCHDYITGRISPVNLIIKESLYSEIAQIPIYECASRETKPYLKIPTLKEYLDISRKYQKHSFIEIKPELSDEEITQLLNETKEYSDGITFISFKYENLRKIRNRNPLIQLQYLVGSFSSEIINLCQEISADVDIHYQGLTRPDIDLFHQNQLKVNVWTVDNPSVAKQLIDWEVDYITTNRLE